MDGGFTPTSFECIVSWFSSVINKWMFQFQKKKIKVTTNVVSTYIWWKEKKSVFLHMEKKKYFSLRIYVQKDWLRDHTSWAACGIEMKIKGILKFWLWISLHQGTLSILYSRIQGYMLSFMNKVDPCLLLPLCVLYDIQNQIFQH